MRLDGLDVSADECSTVLASRGFQRLSCTGYSRITTLHYGLYIRNGLLGLLMGMKGASVGISSDFTPALSDGPNATGDAGADSPDSCADD